LLAEAATVIGTVCLVLHVVTAFGHHPRSVVRTVVMLGMAVACARCLPALWAGPTRRDWTVTGAMYGAMLVAHLAWTALGPESVGHAHTSVQLSWIELGMWGGLGLAGVQLCLAAAGLIRPVRHLRGEPTPLPEEADRDRDLAGRDGA
jgi:Na+(H+)/acetate symporter ActP